MESKLFQKIKDTGIRVSPHFRRGNAFIISLSPDRKKLLIHEGEAKVTVFPSKKHKQVVLRVSENDREFSQEVEKTLHVTGNRSSLYVCTGASNSMEPFLKGTGLTTAKLLDKIGIKIQKDDFRQFHGHLSMTPTTLKVSGEINYMRGKSASYFLAGYDESHLFISELPKAVDSVEKAHFVLQPKGLRDGYFRQGEWFFSPITEAESTALLLDCEMGDIDTNLGGGHRADLTISKDADFYVFGAIRDANRRHEDLILTKLYKVLRNTEIASESGTWD